MTGAAALAAPDVRPRDPDPPPHGFEERAWLAPLGLLFGGLAAARSALYQHGVWRSTRLDLPVVSVGNLGVGGTGKTPVVARVAQLLLACGARVAILARGYGGAFRGAALIVSDGGGPTCDAALAGDEPVMLARALPGAIVAVGARRDVVGRAVAERFGRCVALLDDGFQHLRLRRDLDLVCIDARHPGRWPLPAGRLREFPSAAARADLVLLTQAERVGEERLAALEARFGRERCLRVGHRLEGFADEAGRSAPVPARALLLSGIAAPERFAADVASCGVTIVAQAAFRDHHRFRPQEVAALRARARELGADAVVTTAKDAVRLPAEGWDPPLRVLRLQAVIHDETRLLAHLRRAAGLA